MSWLSVVVCLVKNGLARERYGVNLIKLDGQITLELMFGLKCLIAPDVPNNAGSLSPFEVLAQVGSIVHPQRPSRVTARHVIGQMLRDLSGDLIWIFRNRPKHASGMHA